MLSHIFTCKKMLQTNQTDYTQANKYFTHLMHSFHLRYLAHFQLFYIIRKKYTVILKTFLGIWVVIFENVWRNSTKTVKKLFRILKKYQENF